MRNLFSGRLAVPSTLLILVPGLLAGLAAALMPTAAHAHERRTLDKYTLVVGFNAEPAIQGEPNGAQITVTVPGEDNRPVEGLANTLKTTVAFGGGQPKEFKLRSVFGRPGVYVADLIPTRAGVYIFNFSGSIEGTPIDERFESGPGRFNDVEAVEGLQFPEAVPLANDAVRTARSAGDQAAAATAEAASARSMAMAGIAVGVAGLVVGAAALVLLVARRPAEAVTPERRSGRP